MAHTQRLYMLTAYTQVDTKAQIASALFLCTITRALTIILTMRVVITTTRIAVARGRCTSMCVGRGLIAVVWEVVVPLSRARSGPLSYSVSSYFKTPAPGGPLG